MFHFCCLPACFENLHLVFNEHCGNTLYKLLEFDEVCIHSDVSSSNEIIGFAVVNLTRIKSDWSLRR